MEFIGDRGRTCLSLVNNFAIRSSGANPRAGIATIAGPIGMGKSHFVMIATDGAELIREAGGEDFLIERMPCRARLIQRLKSALGLVVAFNLGQEIRPYEMNPIVNQSNVLSLRILCYFYGLSGGWIFKHFLAHFFDNQLVITLEQALTIVLCDMDQQQRGRDLSN